MSIAPEKTLILLKPDTVQRAIIGQVITRFEQKGFHVAAMKMVKPTEQQLGLHYADDKAWKISVGKKTKETFAAKGLTMNETEEQIGDRIRNWNIDALRQPVVAIVFEGHHAVEVGRILVGDTECRKAAPGTIRGDFSCDGYQKADEDKRVIRNLVHASGSVKEAEHEIPIWFTKEELFDYPRHDWNIMHA